MLLQEIFFKRPEFQMHRIPSLFKKYVENNAKAEIFNAIEELTAKFSNFQVRFLFSRYPSKIYLMPEPSHELMFYHWSSFELFHNQLYFFFKCSSLFRLWNFHFSSRNMSTTMPEKKYSMLLKSSLYISPCSKYDIIFAYKTSQDVYVSDFQTNWSLIYI